MVNTKRLHAAVGENLVCFRSWPGMNGPPASMDGHSLRRVLILCLIRQVDLVSNEVKKLNSRFGKRMPSMTFEDTSLISLRTYLPLPLAVGGTYGVMAQSATSLQLACVDAMLAVPRSCHPA